MEGTATRIGRSTTRVRTGRGSRSWRERSRSSCRARCSRRARRSSTCGGSTSIGDRPMRTSNVGSVSTSSIPTSEEVDHASPRHRPVLFFETMSKRRKGFPSETHVKRGDRIVHGTKRVALVEKLGRRDLCPCGSGRRFAKCCRNSGSFRRRQQGSLLSASDSMTERCSPFGQRSRLTSPSREMRRQSSSARDRTATDNLEFVSPRPKMGPIPENAA